VAELEVIRTLKKELVAKIPLRAFFDLIVGTKYVFVLQLNLHLV